MISTVFTRLRGMDAAEILGPLRDLFRPLRLPGKPYINAAGVSTSRNTPAS